MHKKLHARSDLFFDRYLYWEDIWQYFHKKILPVLTLQDIHHLILVYKSALPPQHTYAGYE